MQPKIKTDTDFKYSIDKSLLAAIKSKWETNFENIGHWQPVAKGSHQYLVKSIISMIRFYFNEKMYEKLIANDTATYIDEFTVKVSNSYAISPEQVPNIIVTIGDTRSYISEIGEHVDDNLDIDYKQSMEGTLSITIEGRDLVECDYVVDRFEAGLHTMIFPALLMLPCPILCKRNFNISQARERMVSADFKPMSRVFNFTFMLDYIPLKFVDDNPIITGVDTENL